MVELGKQLDVESNPDLLNLNILPPFLENVGHVFHSSFPQLVFVTHTTWQTPSSRN